MARNWMIMVEGQTEGPYDNAQMRDLVASGRVDGDTLVMRNDQEQFIPARRVRGLIPEGPAPATTPPSGHPTAAEPAPFAEFEDLEAPWQPDAADSEEDPAADTFLPDPGQPLFLDDPPPPAAADDQPDTAEDTFLPGPGAPLFREEPPSDRTPDGPSTLAPGAPVHVTTAHFARDPWADLVGRGPMAYVRVAWSPRLLGVLGDSVGMVILVAVLLAIGSIVLVMLLAGILAVLPPALRPVAGLALVAIIVAGFWGLVLRHPLSLAEAISQGLRDRQVESWPILDLGFKLLVIGLVCAAPALMAGAFDAPPSLVQALATVGSCLMALPLAGLAHTGNTWAGLDPRPVWARIRQGGWADFLGIVGLWTAAATIATWLAIAIGAGGLWLVATTLGGGLGGFVAGAIVGILCLLVAMHPLSYVPVMMGLWNRRTAADLVDGVPPASQVFAVVGICLILVTALLQAAAGWVVADQLSGFLLPKPTVPAFPMPHFPPPG